MPNYNAAFICPMNVYADIIAAVEKVYKHYTILYWYNKSSTITGIQYFNI